MYIIKLGRHQKMKDQREQDIRRPDTGKNVLRRLMQLSMSVIITLIILLVPAGIIKWIYAWIYTLASVLVIITNAFMTIILFIIRTSFEDNTLKNKLEGYKEYAERVKYRLISGIW